MTTLQKSIIFWVIFNIIVNILIWCYQAHADSGTIGHVDVYVSTPTADQKILKFSDGSGIIVDKDKMVDISDCSATVTTNCNLVVNATLSPNVYLPDCSASITTDCMPPAYGTSGLTTNK